MKRTLVAMAVAFATVSSVAIANAASSGTPSTADSSLRQQMATNLQKSGFSDVKIVPGSFYVRARDQSGNPVSMFITPNSMAEVTTVGVSTDTNKSSMTADKSGTTGNASGTNNHVAATNASDTNAVFATIPSSDELSSKLIGTDVYNHENEDIGTIKDIAISSNGDVNGYILSVGGFLGLGDHYVAVKPSAINLSYNADDKRWHAKMATNSDDLKSAPEFKYPDKAS